MVIADRQFIVIFYLYNSFMVITLIVSNILAFKRVNQHRFTLHFFLQCEITTNSLYETYKNVTPRLEIVS